jgi:hypothetical protein
MPRPSNKRESKQGLRHDGPHSKIRSTHPQKSSPLDYAALKITVLLANMCLQLFCAFAISQYDPTHAIQKVGRLSCSKQVDTWAEGINRVLDAMSYKSWSSTTLDVSFFPESVMPAYL